MASAKEVDWFQVIGTTYCRFDGTNCLSPPGLVLGGGNDGSGVISYSCSAWGVATCSATYGTILCPAGTDSHVTGSENIAGTTIFYRACVKT